MCLIAIAWQYSAEYPFALVANRDEFHARPTTGLSWWPNSNIAAGRDLQAGGTWLGITTHGRFAAVTNVREGGIEQDAKISRGLLVTHVLNSQDSLDHLQRDLAAMGRDAAGFNLLFGDLFGSGHELRYLSNRPGKQARPGRKKSDHKETEQARIIKSGVYALSNGGLDDHWPKTQMAEREMHRALRHRHPDGFWDVTSSRDVADAEDLPDTGVDPDIERFLSAPFIVGKEYGTRSTLRILGQPKSSIVMTERRFDAQGDLTGSSQIRIARPA
jgi:uncharacterized protein with NRDE domain